MKKFYKIVRILLLPFIIIYDEIVFSLLNASKISLNTIINALFFGTAIFLIESIISRYSKKVSKTIIIIILSIISLLFIIESYVYIFFNTFMPLDVVFSNAVNVAKNYSAEAVSAVSVNIFIIPLYILSICIYIFIDKKIDVKYKKNDYVVTLLIVIIFLMASIVLKTKSSKLTDFYINTYRHGLLNGINYSAFATEEKMDNVVFTSETIESSKEKIDERVDEEIYGYNMLPIDFDVISKTCGDSSVISNNNYAKSLIPSKKNKYTGLFKGKNLIMICAESFSKYAVTEKLTPTLYRLMHKGFYFTDAYASTITNSTTEGEFQLLMGIGTGSGNVGMEKTIDKNNFYTAANLMKIASYSTACFHNGNYYYYNRNVTHENIGYEYFMANRSGLMELTNNNNSDFALFDKTFDLYKNKKPFSVYYMTYDGHIPYNKNNKAYAEYADIVKEYYGDDITEERISYIAKMISFDRALENLLKRLEEENIIDDTVIAMASDHFPYGLKKTKNEDLYDLYGQEFSNNDIDIRDSNGIVIWCGALEHDLKAYQKVISVPVNSLDILPTLLNLFGIDYDSRLLVGKDVFSDALPLVFWGNSSFATDRCFYNSINGDVKSKDGSTIEHEYIESILDIVKDKLRFSRYVISTDYYDYIFGDKLKGGYIVNTQIPEELNKYETIKFGKYKGEEIEWYKITEPKDGKVLLLSKYILDVVPYGGDDWNTSFLRTFANETFYNEAFTLIDMSRIVKDNDIGENILIFDISEYEKYFGQEFNEKNENKVLAATGTSYAKSKGLYCKKNGSNWYTGNASYWLRNSNSSEKNYRSTIEYNGHINSYGYPANSTYIGFRPCIWYYIR